MQEPRRTLSLPHGDLDLPAFLPDATHGVVRTVDAADLAGCGIQAVVMNTYHLMQRPGSSTIKALGGLHAMSSWQGPIVTDSGGFQAYSLIRQHPRFGRMSDAGMTFRPAGSAREFTLTPEKCIQLQLGYDTDVAICLDDCTHADAPLTEQELAVKRTISWAQRCKREFVRVVEERRLPVERRPLLFGVIQGGREPELRRRCAEALLEIGFDGLCYGGWPLDASNTLLHDIIAYTRELVPRQFPMHALGIGHPANVVACARLGYDLFDSAMPTRDARHARLYTVTPDALTADWPDRHWLDFLYIGDEKHIKSRAPISAACDCLTCQRYSRGYLHHLFKLAIRCSTAWPPCTMCASWPSSWRSCEPIWIRMPTRALPRVWKGPLKPRYERLLRPLRSTIARAPPTDRPVSEAVKRAKPWAAAAAGSARRSTCVPTGAAAPSSPCNCSCDLVRLFYSRRPGVRPSSVRPRDRSDLRVPLAPHLSN